MPDHHRLVYFRALACEGRGELPKEDANARLDPWLGSTSTPRLVRCEGGPDGELAAGNRYFRRSTVAVELDAFEF
jgi:hypothetical protein